MMSIPRKMARHFWNRSPKENWRALANRIAKSADPVGFELRRLRSIPRYTRCSSNLLGKPLTIIDSASFCSSFREIFLRGIYSFISETANPYIVDCGANIGLSVIFFKQKYPTAEVIAFEPDPKVLLALNRNIESFQLHSVTVMPKALWDAETLVRFYSEGADGGKVLLEDESSNGRKSEITASTVRLIDYVKREVDFLKMDIEGAETVVLKDIEPYLGNVKRVFIEFHSQIGKTQSLGVILRLIEAAGFRYYLENIGVPSSKPFCKIESFAGADNQINIFAYRVHRV